MLEDISQIQARIGEIQSRIDALSGQPQSAPPAPTPGQAQPKAFADTLHRAQTARTNSPIVGGTGTSGVFVPPASLGPLPTMPISLDATHLIPLRRAGGDYDNLIKNYASKHNLPPALVRAVIHAESGGNPQAVSRAGAMGLMQLMPANVSEAGISDPFDPEQNIAAGTEQLAGLLAQYHGDLDLTLAGYNAGPGAVRKWGGVPPYAETREYIKKVRAAMEKG